MQNERFDVIVIGGGPGGYTAAAKASALGGKVAVVERSALGGTCLNLGCIPTKTLLKSTEVLESVKKAKDFGVDISEATVSLEKILNRKEGIIKRLNTGVEFLMKSNNITIIRGEGKVTGIDEVTVTTPSEEIVLKTRNIIVATGSRPAAIPGLEPDGHWIMNSDQALMLASIPERLLIIGGGAIGVEFASIYQKLGAKVTLVEAMDRILPFSDREVSDALKQLMAREKIVVLTESKVAGIQKSAEGLLVKVETPKGSKEIQTDKVLVAVGRCPEYENLGLPEIGVTVEKGKIAVNSKMETNIPNIYAIGDVIGGILLAHVASAEGTVAAINAMGGQKHMNYRVIPSCIYTSPELASVGLTEEEAVSRGLKIVVGKSQFTGSGKALAMGENKGLVKIVAEAVSGKILGVHILGPQATSLISEAALAINLGAVVNDIADTIHAHPSLPETLLEAAEEAVRLIESGKE
ncbi:dihydrolipoyl dehydrogenase [Desulfosporosinus meridiei]|uniref:Dihydrolipoyl dehydrogenase n=1 Tax=Desulfosporosinus meridiei (strain ATCC BAA-275 / DSM 13257 / KCTC 12902 / NCIMB 13706 / S10) TaxID=768704 RepID=J7IYW3_DESMD|nr:dihydrolipoyl dehydrogenase [Desulfosporosinus meridiei]AFQ43881.1 dihydrolipoamide dehydrogenase [Desulfosporosinus meridiei DSM 13257]